MHNQSQEVSSFLLHKLQSSGQSASSSAPSSAPLNGSARRGMDERMQNELQKFLELERLRRNPTDEEVAPVTKLLPQAGRFLRVVS